jgi:hypothetical protein
MAFVQISNSDLDQLRVLAKQSKAIGKNKEVKDFAQEAFSFYFAYLGFLVNEKNALIIMKDLEISEDAEKALDDLEKLNEAIITHICKDSFNQYKESKKVLQERILSLKKEFINT